jgi:hypothetical protein
MLFPEPRAGALRGCRHGVHHATPSRVHPYRFFGVPGVGPNSHFFTHSPTECLAVVTKYPGWAFEGSPFWVRSGLTVALRDHAGDHDGIDRVAMIRAPALAIVVQALHGLRGRDARVAIWPGHRGSSVRPHRAPLTSIGDNVKITRARSVNSGNAMRSLPFPPSVT